MLSLLQVRQCFPDTLLALMSILYNEYKQIRLVMSKNWCSEVYNIRILLPCVKKGC